MSMKTLIALRERCEDLSDYLEGARADAEDVELIAQIEHHIDQLGLAVRHIAKIIRSSNDDAQAVEAMETAQFDSVVFGAMSNGDLDRVIAKVRSDAPGQHGRSSGVTFNLVV